MENGLERVELHVHSTMSENDAVIRPEKIVSMAASLGHKACAITDHGSVQGFPDFYNAVTRLNRDRDEGEKFKPIFGCEVSLIDDGPAVFYNLPSASDKDLRVDFIVAVALNINEDNATFTKVAASKFRLDHDSNEYVHVEDFCEDIDDRIYPGEGEPCGSYFCMERLSDFIGGAYITGENIFDVLGLLRRAGFGVNIEEQKYFRVKFNMPAISVEDIKEYVCSEASVPVSDDLQNKAYNCGKFVAGYISKEGTFDPYELNRRIGHKSAGEFLSSECKPSHLVLLAQNLLGIYNLYRLISESHGTGTPRSLVKYYRSSLLTGSACESGEIYHALQSIYLECGKDGTRVLDSVKQNRRFKEMMDFYDYVELQPLSNKMEMTADGSLDVNDLKNINILLADIVDLFGKPAAATSDAHYLRSEDAVIRDCLKGEKSTGDLYFRDTRQMLDEFSYLGESRAYEVVVTNTNLIADKIEYGVKPFPEGNFFSDQSKASAEVRNIACAKAEEIYGRGGDLDPAVKERLDKELEYITGNGYSNIFYIAYRLVKSTIEDGYISGFRGVTGNSLVAYFLGITEVNPLAPHYLCPQCKHVEFVYNSRSGFDLQPKECPFCGAWMRGDGHDLPVEMCMGYYGDKMPDITLNLAGDSRKKAFSYLKEWYGDLNVISSGVIKKYSARSATEMVRDYSEQIKTPLSESEQVRVSAGIVGVKRGDSIHPGKVFIIPEKMDVYEFTPVNYLQSGEAAEVPVTHFNSMDLRDTVLFIDILEHSCLQLLRELQDNTGVKIKDIPFNDPSVMLLLQSGDTIGLLDFENLWVREKIAMTEPSGFNDFSQILGLAHGTGTWRYNADILIKDGICDIGSVVAFRDTIMTELIRYGIGRKDAFDIAEFVRKGKASHNRRPDIWSRYKALMKEYGVPDWTIDSCEEVEYMFPKGHAIGYTINDLRLAWFKSNYPVEFYCAYLTCNKGLFRSECMLQGSEAVKARMHELLKNEWDDVEARREYDMCTLVNELYEVGISFTPDSIGKTDITKFIKAGDNLIQAV